MSEHPHIEAALAILAAPGLPRAQQNENSALCLLALLGITPMILDSSVGRMPEGRSAA